MKSWSTYIDELVELDEHLSHLISKILSGNYNERL